MNDFYRSLLFVIYRFLIHFQKTYIRRYQLVVILENRIRIIKYGSWYFGVVIYIKAHDWEVLVFNKLYISGNTGFDMLVVAFLAS